MIVTVSGLVSRSSFFCYVYISLTEGARYYSRCVRNLHVNSFHTQKLNFNSASSPFASKSYFRLFVIHLNSLFKCISSPKSMFQNSFSPFQIPFPVVKGICNLQSLLMVKLIMIRSFLLVPGMFSRGRRALFLIGVRTNSAPLRRLSISNYLSYYQKHFAVCGLVLCWNQG